MKNLMPGTITAFVLLSLGLGLAPQAAFAQTMNGLIQKGGQNCKMKAVEQFSVPMSDVSVSLGETFKESIDKGDIDLKDIKKNGLSFNWVVTRDGKKTDGYCNTDGKGNVTEFKQ
ncbi:MAG: hypothetical protein KA717_39950 [Woronichinia naegeliana WA131]|jgi:hypothetical protein|uniref:Uncharacterized protein n=1 Tax=Woronichinia naegeliana WA131 TaxID=2824559 RepID=A0A977KWZ9_9CYAN|nr:MAG: hypothetical protein KA717_39950 [Woronichinia naegeliana WA131]